MHALSKNLIGTIFEAQFLIGRDVADLVCNVAFETMAQLVIRDLER